MPVHDWTRVDAGLFHHFHQDWTIELCRSLNLSNCVAIVLFEALRQQGVGH